MKLVISLGVVVAIVVGYFLLAPSQSPDIAQDAAIAPAQAEQSPEDMIALKRESLPSALTDTVTLNDAVFFPRMGIIEYVYVSTTPDAGNFQNVIQERAQTLCREVRDMFGSEMTLRNSFEDANGTLLRRIYLLQEDCQQFE